MTIMVRPAKKDRDEGPGGPEGEAVKEALDRLVPVLTGGMPPEEAGKARETLTALYTLRAAEPGGPAGLRQETEARLRLAHNLSPEGRRRLLQEDELTLGVRRLGGQVFRDALGVMRGEVQATPELKRETRRTMARLGRLNAVLVGRFPHLAGPLAEVSEAYLDAMFIIGDGKGPLSTRLRKAKEDGRPAGDTR